MNEAHRSTGGKHGAAHVSGKSGIVFLLGVSGLSVLLCALPLNSVLHSGEAAQPLPLCPNGLLMATTFCSTRRGHRGKGWGGFACVCAHPPVFDFTFEMVDGCIKETEDIQLIKPK